MELQGEGESPTGSGGCDPPDPWPNSISSSTISPPLSPGWTAQLFHARVWQKKKKKLVVGLDFFFFFFLNNLINPDFVINYKINKRLIAY